MNERTKTGLDILRVAVLIGVLGDILLRVTPWGVNVPMFNAAFAVGTIMLFRRHKPEFLTARSLSLFGALVFFAAMFAWRDSIELRVADSFAILTILSALFLHRMRIATHLAGVFHYVIAFFGSAISAAGAPFILLVSDIEWKSMPNSGWKRHAFSALRGVAIVTPILLIFGGLFVAADAVYQGWVERVFNIRPEIVFTHVLLTATFAWVSAGYLRGVLTGPLEKETSAAASNCVPNVNASESCSEPDVSRMDRVRAESGEYPVTLPNHLSITEHINISDPPDPKTNAPAASGPAGSGETEEKKPWQWANIDNEILPRAFTLGAVEVGVIFGLINLLFLSFVIVQMRYLFGGMDLVQNTPDFKLAVYARRGFGELVTVSALVLPLLLSAHWLLRKDSPLAGKLFRVFAGIQIGLLFVIMASAVQRLVLLTGSLGYGMTTVRLYPMILMIWLAIVFVWFGATVLRGARQYFAWGALWSAFLILGTTHALNPDGFIVRTNVQLLQQGREFDAYYNSGLSDDSLPVLVQSFPVLDERSQQIVLRSLARRNCEKQNEGDLRSWNLSRWNASLELAPYQEVLNRSSCKPGDSTDDSRDFR